eukprot:6446191-Pyramimonas_sp.AAC.1
MLRLSSHGRSCVSPSATSMLRAVSHPSHSVTAPACGGRGGGGRRRERQEQEGLQDDRKDDAEQDEE